MRPPCQGRACCATASQPCPQPATRPGGTQSCAATPASPHPTWAGGEGGGHESKCQLCFLTSLYSGCVGRGPGGGSRGMKEGLLAGDMHDEECLKRKFALLQRRRRSCSACQCSHGCRRSRPHTHARTHAAPATHGAGMTAAGDGGPLAGGRPCCGSDCCVQQAGQAAHFSSVCSSRGLQSANMASTHPGSSSNIRAYQRGAG